MNLPKVHKYIERLSDLLDLLDSLYKEKPKYIYYSQMEDHLRWRSKRGYGRTMGQIFRFVSKDDILESLARNNTEPLKHYVSHFEEKFESFDKSKPSSWDLYRIVVTLHNLFDALDDLRVWIETYSREVDIDKDEYRYLYISGEFEQRGEDIKTIIEALACEED